MSTAAIDRPARESGFGGTDVDFNIADTLDSAADPVADG